MRYVISVLLALSMTLSVQGQKAYTLKELQTIAAENSAKMRLSFEMRQQADDQCAAAKSNYFPKVSARGIALYSNAAMEKTIRGKDLFPSVWRFVSREELANSAPELHSFLQRALGIPITHINLQTGFVYMGGIELEQPIFMGGKILAGNRMAAIGRDVATLKGELHRQELLIEVEESYWNCIRAKELVIASEKYLETVTEFHRVVTNAVEVGLKHSNDAMRVAVKRDEVALALLRAKNRCQLAEMNLRYLVGLADSIPLIIDANFVTDEVQLPEEISIERRPESALLACQVAFKRQQELFVRADFLPNIGMKVCYNYLNGGAINDRKLFDNTSLSALVAINIPITHWGEGIHKKHIAQSETRVAEIEQKELSVKMLLEATMLRNTLLESIEEVALTRKALATAEEHQKVCRNQYDVGKETLANYLEAQTLWQKAVAEHINAKALLQINNAKYRKAIGSI